MWDGWIQLRGKEVRGGMQDGTVHFEEIHGMCRIHMCHMPDYVHGATNCWSEWCRAVLEVPVFRTMESLDRNLTRPTDSKKRIHESERIYPV